MPVQSMQRVAEHSLFKAALPLVCAALIGSITWIFVTVMDIDKVLHRVEDSEIPQINRPILCPECSSRFEVSMGLKMIKCPICDNRISL